MFYISNTVAAVKSATRENAVRAIEDMLRATPSLVAVISTVGGSLDGNRESFRMVGGKVVPAYGADAGTKVRVI